MIVKRMARLSLLVASAMLAVFALAADASADPTVAIEAGSGDTTGSGSVDPIDASAASGDTSAGISTGSGSGSAAGGTVTSGGTSGSVGIGCIDASLTSGSTSGGAQFGSCAGSSVAGGGAASTDVASAGAPVAGNTSASAQVGCIDAAGASGSTAASAGVGSCRSAGGAAAGSLESGDAAARAGVGCIEAGAAGPATAAARVGACPQTQEESPTGPATPGPGGSTDGSDLGNGTLGHAGVLGANTSGEGGGVLAGLRSGELPLTGLPLMPVFLAAVAALILAFAMQRRRARHASRA
jgi:hypothetical protein